uniref:Amiloride-sensitive sodium channel n=1 Tax=Syphacia muris TaxID=451379 RepID=A0A158R594_9BILA
MYGAKVFLLDMNDVEQVGGFRNKGPNWKEIFIGETCKKYAFWFLIGFLAALTIKDVAELVMEYMEDPKLTDFTIVFNESMTMPNITFCMSKTQGMSHFNIENLTETADEWDQIVKEQLANMTDRESFLKTPWNFRMVMDAYETIAYLSSIERELMPHDAIRNMHLLRTHPKLEAKRQQLETFLTAIKERNVTFQEFTQKTGTEVLRRSVQRFQRFHWDEDVVIKTSPRITWISTMQMCFQPEYNEKNFLPITDQGKFFILMMSHNTENLKGQNVDCMSIDVHGRPSSLARFMQAKAQVMDGTRNDLCLGSRHEITMEVRAKYEMIENDDEGTACHEFEEGEDDEFQCHSRCRLELIRSVCKCTALSLSYLVTDEAEFKQYPLCNYTQCIIDVQRGNYTDEKCGKQCHRDCSQIRFNVNLETKGRMARQDLTLIEVHWGSFEYLNLKQERKYTIVTFAAAVGGSIGVWLGLSVLSLMQFVYLTTRNRRSLVKGHSIDDDQDGRLRKNNSFGSVKSYRA